MKQASLRTLYALPVAVSDKVSSADLSQVVEVEQPIISLRINLPPAVAAAVVAAAAAAAATTATATTAAIVTAARLYTRN